MRCGDPLGPVDDLGLLALAAPLALGAELGLGALTDLSQERVAVIGVGRGEPPGAVVLPGSPASPARRLLSDAARRYRADVRPGSRSPMAGRSGATGPSRGRKAGPRCPTRAAWVGTLSHNHVDDAEQLHQQQHATEQPTRVEHGLPRVVDIVGHVVVRSPRPEGGTLRRLDFPSIHPPPDALSATGAPVGRRPVVATAGRDWR